MYLVSRLAGVRRQAVAPKDLLDLRWTLLSRQIYSNYTAILPYTYLGRVLRGEDGGRREERSEVMYCIVRDTYLYIIDVRTDHAVLCVVLFGTHQFIY